ncbi:hypothetical protein GQ42DRAFT_171302 [Ramicandelaber brevisporus]|nr:hypothetical protein GQ42DRAFT_171302 [Ramicandelaber brevisporus]
MTRQEKPKRSLFNGSTDPKTFLNRCEATFRVDKVTDDDDKIAYARILVAENIEKWMDANMPYFTNWGTFRLLLIKHCGAANDLFSSVLRMIKPFKGNAMQMRDRINEVAADIPGFGDYPKLIVWLINLPEKRRKEILHHGLKDYHQYVQIAQSIEFVEGNGTATMITPERDPDAMEIDAIQARGSSRGAYRSGSHGKATNIDLSGPMTADVRRHLEENGGCYYCRVINADHIADQCPNKPGSRRGQSSSRRGQSSSRRGGRRSVRMRETECDEYSGGSDEYYSADEDDYNDTNDSGSSTTTTATSATGTGKQHF